MNDQKVSTGKRWKAVRQKRRNVAELAAFEIWSGQEAWMPNFADHLLPVNGCPKLAVGIPSFGVARPAVSRLVPLYSQAESK